MDLARAVYHRDLKIATMRQLDAGASAGEVARKYQLSPKLLERWRSEWRAKGEAAFPGIGRRGLEMPPASGPLQIITPRDNRKVQFQALARERSDAESYPLLVSLHVLPDLPRTPKGFTAKQANQILALKGPFWVEESSDRLVRNAIEAGQLAGVVWLRYNQNPAPDPDYFSYISG